MPPMQPTKPTKPTAGAVVDYASLRPYVESDAVLANVGRFLSRGGFAVRSALSGDLLGSAQNVAEFGTDFISGGIGVVKPSLNPFRLMARAGGIGPAPTPEVTDMLKAWGMRPPAEGTWSRTGLNVLGGAATDPLTYATFWSGAGRVAVRGLAGAALNSLDDVARPLALATIRRGLTPAADGLLAAERVPFLARRGLVPGDIAGQLAARGVPNPTAVATRLERLADDFALDRLIAQHAGAARNRQFVVAGRGDSLTAAEDSLHAAGLLQRPAITFMGRRIPGTEVAGGGGQVASALARYSIPGLLARGARAGVGKIDPRLGAALDAGAAFPAALYSKYLVGTVPASARLAAEYADFDRAARVQQSRRWVEEQAPSFVRGPGPQGSAQVEAFSDAFHQAQDVWRQTPLAGRTAAFRAQLDAQLDARLQAAGLPVGPARAWREKAAEVQRDLQRKGIWKVDPDLDNPYYFPQQVRAEIREALGPGASALGGSLGRDVFTEGRKFKTHDEWVDHVTDVVATKAAADPVFAAKLKTFGVDPAVRGSAVERDALRLMSNRLDAHANTMARHGFQTAIDRMKGTLPATSTAERAALDSYMQRTWTPLALEGGTGVEPRKGIQWILGGGRRADGTKWRGLHAIFKTALYAVWPSSWGRDLYGAAFSVGLDPAIGTRGAYSMFARTLMDLPIVRVLGRTLTNDDTTKFLAAVRGDAGARAAVANLKIGKYSGDEVLSGLDQILGRSVGSLDIDADDLRIEKLGLEIRGGGGPDVLDKLGQFGYGVAGALDRSLRTQHFMALLARGHHPAEAASKVTRAFVDYNLQGKADRWFRDLTVFGRYPLAITPHVVKGLAARPRGGIALARFNATEGEGRESSLPEHLRSGIAFRIPGPSGRWASSFGTPHEAAAGAIEGLTSPEAFRRQWLSMLSPPLRYPAEAVTGTNFRFGGDFGSYRHAPRWLPDFLTQEVGGPAGPQREIPGWVNELIRATPGSRLSGTVDALLGATDPKATRGGLDALLGLTTGVRTQKIDEARAARQQNLAALEALVERGEVGEQRIFWGRGDRDALSEEALRELEIHRALSAASRKKSR